MDNLLHCFVFLHIVFQIWTSNWFTFKLMWSSIFTGSAELAAIGVSVSLINLVSKLFNIPLLNVTTSFVAEQQALQNGTAGMLAVFLIFIIWLEVNVEPRFSYLVGKKDFGFLLEPTGGKKYLPAVSTSLALAAGIGIVEAITLSLGSGPLLNFMGIPVVRHTMLIMLLFLTRTSYSW